MAVKEFKKGDRIFLASYTFHTKSRSRTNKPQNWETLRVDPHCYHIKEVKNKKERVIVKEAGIIYEFGFRVVFKTAREARLYARAEYYKTYKNGGSKYTKDELESGVFDSAIEMFPEMFI